MRGEMCRWSRDPSSGFRKASCINRAILRRIRSLTTYFILFWPDSFSFEVCGDYFFEIIAVFLGNFYEADTHTNGGIVILYAIEIRPDYLAANPHGRVIGGRDGNAVGFM